MKSPGGGSDPNLCYLIRQCLWVIVFVIVCISLHLLLPSSSCAGKTKRCTNIGRGKSSPRRFCFRRGRSGRRGLGLRMSFISRTSLRTGTRRSAGHGNLVNTLFRLLPITLKLFRDDSIFRRDVDWPRYMTISSMRKLVSQASLPCCAERVRP